MALAQNVWQYGTDPSQGTTFWDRTVKNREFWVSLGVDFGSGVAVGVVSSAVVSGIIAIALAILSGRGLSVGTGVAIPTVAIGVTLGVGAYISWELDALSVPENLKAIINNKFAGGGKGVWRDQEVVPLFPHGRLFWGVYIFG